MLGKESENNNNNKKKIRRRNAAPNLRFDMHCAISRPTEKGGGGPPSTATAPAPAPRDTTGHLWPQGRAEGRRQRRSG